MGWVSPSAVASSVAVRLAVRVPLTRQSRLSVVGSVLVALDIRFTLNFRQVDPLALLIVAARAGSKLGGCRSIWRDGVPYGGTDSIRSGEVVAPLSSVTNALRVLKSYDVHHREWGVSELARHLDIGKSTAHRLLATMTEERILEQDAETGRYRLGIAIVDLAGAVATQYDLHEAVLTPMTELRQRSGETVQVAVLDGREVVYVERLDSPNTLRTFLEVGRRNHAHCTATGKALLSCLPERVLEKTLNGWVLAPVTPHTIINIKQFRLVLKDARENGYAENWHESEVGVVSIGAPIHARDGHVVAALSIAGPSERIEPYRREFAHATMETAAKASRRLGYRRSTQ